MKSMRKGSTFRLAVKTSSSSFKETEMKTFYTIDKTKTRLCRDVTEITLKRLLLSRYHIVKPFSLLIVEIHFLLTLLKLF